MRPPPYSPLFPYTTLFRSSRPASLEIVPTSDPIPGRVRRATRCPPPPSGAASPGTVHTRSSPSSLRRPRTVGSAHARSEEHTSELQSQSNLVCRLLLEKKK